MHMDKYPWNEFPTGFSDWELCQKRHAEALARIGRVLDWRPIDTVPPEMKDGIAEIVALSPAYVGKDGKPGLIVLRWFKYNGLAAWRDWDADAHFPTHWHPLAELPPNAPAVDKPV